MTDTTNPTAKYSKNYSGDVGETPKSMAGTWHLEAPDGRRWAGSCPINCVAQELAERVPVQVQLARMLAVVAEPDLDERHAKLGVEYGTGKVDDLVDKLHAEITELRAKLEALERQEHAAFVNEQGFIVERDDMQVASGERLYLAAGARPVEPAPAAVVGPSEVHEAIRNVQAQYLALTKAAVNLVTAVDDRHDHHEAPLRYTIPYGAVTALREAITAAPQPAPAAQKGGA